MNAYVSTPITTNTESITVKLVGQNFTTGEQYFGRTIPLNFFETAIEKGHEIDIHAGLTDLENVFDFAENKVLAYSLNADEFGMSDLRENYGQTRSNEALENICDNLPKAHSEQVCLYWNHQQFIDDLFINECKFLTCGKVQVVISNR